MNRVIVIAQNTFRESVRDKIFYNLLIFALLMVAASFLIAELSLNLEQIIITRMGLSVMLFFGMLISIFIGTGLVYKEIDKRTIYAMLAKPIRRWEFVLGKFFGLSTTLFVNCAIMMIGVVVSLTYLSTQSMGTFSKFSGHILLAGFLLFLELLIVVAIALLFSSFSTPALSMMFSIVLYLIGTLSNDLLLFANTTPSLPLKYFVLVFYYALPNLANFNYITTVAQGQPIPTKDALMAILYAFIYISLLLVATITIFQKRNFK